MRAEGLFRPEALEEHRRAFDREGTVLRIAPAWTSAAYWLVTAVVVSGLAFVALVSVPRYAEGPAIVRVGQLEDGARAPTIGARPELLVFLPGRHLGSLLPGMTLRFELDGWPRTYQETTVETVGTSVLGTAEARRLLGPVLGDSLPLRGPLVLLRVRLPAEGLRAERQTLPYRDGMVGRAEVRLESERLLFLLVPALRGPRGD
jgi:hypothetical protein